MRILFIANYSELYGANRSMFTLINYLKNKGNDIYVILPEHGSFEMELKQKGIDYIVIHCFTQLYYYKLQLKYLLLPLLYIHAYLQLPKIKKVARSFAPDLIYSNTSAENLGIKVAKSLGIKHISHIREFMDLDYAANFIFGNKQKKKYINQSDGVIYVSNAVARHVNLDEPLQKWQKVIYNGIDNDNVSFVPKSFFDTINLGIVGIFDPAKGQDLAINIMPKILKSFPNAKLHIWGDKAGAYKRKLFDLVESLHLKNNVIFHGFEKNPNIIYDKMDILMMCSRCEGFGRVTVEAMLRAIPVLGYNSGGTSELVKNGENGYLFTSPEQCVFGLKKILSSENEFNRIRKNAFDDAHMNYNVELYCSRVEEFINMIVKL